MKWLIGLLAVLGPCALTSASVSGGAYEALGPVSFVQCPPDHNATIADPDGCKYYYHCVNGYAWPVQCPRDQHFKPTATGLDCAFRMCVPEADSGCVDSLKVAEKEQLLAPYFEAQEADLKKQQAEEEASQEDYYPCFRDENGNWADITLPNRKDCNQYYDCVGGISWPNNCPPTTYYTPKISWLGPLQECKFATCVPFEEARCAIDGAWSSWGEWGECSTSCGDGLQIRERLCDDPPPVNAGDECPGLALDAKLCNLGECRENLTAVFVTTLVDMSTGTTEQDPVEFQSIIVNTDSSFDPLNNQFTAPRDGNYLIAINAGALAFQPVSMYLKGSPAIRPFGNYRNHEGHVGRDCTSSVNIVPMKHNETVRIAAAAGTSLASDTGKPTSWAIFNIDEISDGNSLFAYAYDTPEPNPTNPLQFNINVTERNGGYDPATGYFRPILPGVWFVSYGAGVDSTGANIPIDFTMSCSGTCGQGFISTKINRAHTVYQGIDTIARPLIIDVPAGSQIIVTSSQAYWSSDALPVSFTGFYYQPQDSANRIAWMVARNGDWEDSLPLDPVSFNRAVVNIGGGWEAEIPDYYTVQVSGYYLVLITAGAKANKRVDMRIYQNADYIFDVYRQSVQHDGVDVLSRTGVFFFEQGDRLRLRASGNTALHSSVIGYETSFGGLLLFPSDSSTSAQHAQAMEMAEEADNLFAGFKV